MWSTNCCGRRILGWLGELDNLESEVEVVRSHASEKPIIHLEQFPALMQLPRTLGPYSVEKRTIEMQTTIGALSWIRTF
jgi:hypothetical protein